MFVKSLDVLMETEMTKVRLILIHTCISKFIEIRGFNYGALFINVFIPIIQQILI